MAARETPDVVDHGVLRFLTAGSVDDGKSTLIGRLLVRHAVDPRRSARRDRTHVETARAGARPIAA